MKIETFLPLFPGFYNTYFEADGEEEEVDYINEERAKKGLDEIGYDDIEFDYADYNERVSEEATNFVSSEIDIPMDIKYQSLSSPKYYNYANDSINIEVDITEDALATLVIYLGDNAEEFENYISDNYTSYDGFSSHYSNDSDDWMTEYMLEIEDNSHILGALLGFILENEGVTIEDMYLKATEDVYLIIKNYDELTGDNAVNLHTEEEED